MNKRKIAGLVFLFLSSSALALPNPAATNCTDKGYRYLLVQNVGVCLFPDNSYCEEWAFFRGNCQPGQNKAVIGTNPPLGSASPNNNTNNSQQ